MYNFKKTGKPKEKIVVRGYPQPPEMVVSGDPWAYLLGEKQRTWEDVPYGDSIINIYKEQKPKK